MTLVDPKPSRLTELAQAPRSTALLDEVSKREIRRAILTAVAVPGYQVPFASREMPVARGWGSGGLQVTLAVVGDDDVATGLVSATAARDAAAEAAATTALAKLALRITPQQVARVHPRRKALTPAQAAAAAASPAAAAALAAPPPGASLAAFFTHEVAQAEKVVAAVRATQKQITDAVAGRIVMTTNIVDDISVLATSRVPPGWVAVSGLPLESAAAWVDAVRRRFDQLELWAQHGRLRSYWVGGFFFPKGFLTSVRQEFSRSFALALDAVVVRPEISRYATLEQFGGAVAASAPLDNTAPWAATGGGSPTGSPAPAGVGGSMPGTVSASALAATNASMASAASGTTAPAQSPRDHPPLTVVFVHGLFLEGAGWDKVNAMLTDAVPHVLQTPLPLLRLIAASPDGTPIGGPQPGALTVGNTVVDPNVATGPGGVVVKSAVTDLAIRTFQCPCYTTSLRTMERHLFDIHLRTAEPSLNKWILNGTALVCTPL